VGGAFWLSSAAKVEKVVCASLTQVRTCVWVLTKKNQTKTSKKKKKNQTKENPFNIKKENQ